MDVAGDVDVRSGEQLHSELVRRWSEAKATDKPTPAQFEQLRVAREKGQIDVPEVNPSSFAAIPPVICFQGSTDSVLLTLINRDTAAHTVRLKANHTAAPWLLVTGKKKLGERIAQGMEAVVSLRCTAIGKSAATLLVFNTDEGELRIPVMVMGPRSQLQLPEEVTVGEVICKHTVSKRVTVENTGSAEATFALHTDGPFSVTPGYLGVAPGQFADFTVSMRPSTCGKQTAPLVLLFPQGEIVGVPLHGQSMEAAAKLDTNELVLDDNAVGMTGSKVVTFRNWTASPLKFSWCRYCLPEMDEILEEEDTSHDMMDLMSGADRLGSEYRPSPKTLHDSQMSGAAVMLSGLATGEDEGVGGTRRQPFESDTLRIDPMTGVIPPKSLFDFTVVFSPEAAELHVETAYLDVDGFAERIPMEIRGLGTGASFTSNTSVMNLGHVMVHERNNFEIQLTNTSLIAGDFELIPPDSELAMDISVSPTSGRIEAGRMCILQVGMTATLITDYDETLVIAVINSACRVPLRIRATASGPLLHFTPDSLQFDPVGYGFSTKAQVTLTNTSHQAIRFSLSLLKGETERDEVARALAKKAQRAAGKKLRKAERAQRRAARAKRRTEGAARARNDEGDTDTAEDEHGAARLESPQPISDGEAESSGSESESDVERVDLVKNRRGETNVEAAEKQDAATAGADVHEGDDAETSGDEAVRNAGKQRTVKRNGKQVRVKRKYKAPFKVEEVKNRLIGAYESCTFWVKQRANCVGNQDDVCELSVDGIEGVLARMPVRGLCTTPDLRIAEPVVDIGQAFLQATYPKLVKIHNDSSIPALFCVAIDGLGSEFGQGAGRLDCEPDTGVIAAGADVNLLFTFEPFLTGAGKVVAKVGCVGSDVRQEIQFLFDGSGPCISLSVPLTSELEWGRIPLLKHTPKVITLQNQSPVVARVDITCDPEEDFTVKCHHYVLPAHKNMMVTIMARVSIAKKRTGILTIIVDRGSTFQLPLSAIGYGTALLTKPDFPLITPEQAALVTMKPTAKFKSGEKALSIDTEAEIAAGIKVFRQAMPDQYSLTEHEHVIEVFNQGWSPVECSVSTWGYAASRIHHMRMAQRDDDGAVDRTKAAVAVPEEMLPVFRIDPEKFFIKPFESQVVLLKGYSKSARYVQERLLFHTVVGKSKTKEKAMSLDVCCTFVRPLLRISHKELTFEQVVPPGLQAREQKRTLTLTNENDLEIVCTVAAYSPFGYYSEGEKCRQEVEFHIPRKADLALDVFFDPRLHTTKSSMSITQSLSIIYRHHSQVDQVKLHGSVSFPNLRFDREEIDFGYLAWHTTKTECILVTNDGDLPVFYRWELLQGRQKPGSDDDEGLGAEVASSSDCDDDDDDDDNASLPKPTPLSEIALFRPDIQLSSSTDTGKEKQADRDPDRERSSPDGGVDSDHQPADRQAQRLADAGGPVRKDSKGVSELRLDVETPASNLYVSQPALDSRSALHEEAVEPFRNVPRPKAERVMLFDVMPFFGIIEAGDTQVFAFDFTAKSRIMRQCEAVCSVRGGPKYAVTLRGAASKTRYRLRSRDLNCGTLLFNVNHHFEYYIHNTGRGAFSFTVHQAECVEEIKFCEVSPAHGRVEPGEKFILALKIFPGLPEDGIARFGIRIEHHRREEVTVRWNGQLSTLTLNIPRLVTDNYIRLTRVAQKSLAKRGFPVASEVIVTLLEELRYIGKRAYDYTTTCDMDKEQLKATLNAVREVLCSSRSLPVLPEMVASAPLLPVIQLQLDAEMDRLWTSEYHIRRVNDMPQLPSLPEHGIDFGLVKVYEPLYTNFRADNASEYPVAFHLDQRQLDETGFYLTSTRSREVRSRTHALIEVHYDPFRRLGSKGRPKLSQAELESALVDRCGKVSAYVFFEIPDQPAVAVRIQAELYQPFIDLSTYVIPFANTKTGQCSVEVITVCNQSPVAIRWQAVTEKPKGPKLDKFLPLHLRKQASAEFAPKPVFSTIPQSGVLSSKEVQQVAVIFTPQEQKSIKEVITFVVDGLESTVLLKVTGKALEPHLTFPAGTRTIGPMLPCDTMSSEFVIENPCGYPIEFVATQFDKQTRIEEKILNWDDTFDAINKMILPPREAGKGLPAELLQEYDEGLRKVHEERKHAVAAAAEELNGETSTLDISSTVALAESSSSLRGKSRTSTKGSARDAKEKEKKKEKKESKKEKEVREAAEAEALAAIRLAELEAERERAMSPMSRIKHWMASLSADVMPPMDFKNMSTLHYTQLLTDPHLGLRDATPPSLRAICRHLGIDASDQGRHLRRSQGIAIIIHGAPCSGKTTQAERLAERFHVKTIRVDDVLREAIDARDQFGGAKAFEFLAQARIRILQEAQRELESLQQAASGTGGRKTKQGGGMNRTKPSTSSLQPAGGGGRISPNAKAPTSDGTAPAALADLNETIDAAVVERATMDPEDIKVHLDEEIAVEILKHRLLRDEHYLGAVFDGLQTDILEGMDAMFRVIRRALGRRKYFYFFDLYCDKAGLGRREWQRPFFEYTLYGEAVAVEPLKVPDWRTIEEDDYLALDEKTRKLVDAQQLEAKREVKRKRLEKEAEERKIRELKEAEERRLEEERNQKKKKKFAKAVGVSPAVSTVNLAKGMRSRPTSAVKAKDSTHHLLVADSKASVFDAGEAGKSKLLAPSRSRLESLSALAVDQIVDRMKQEAGAAEDEPFNEELPGFAEYYASRASLTKVMSQWHEDKECFVDSDEKPAVPEQEVSAQPVQQAANPPPRKQLGRLKEMETKIDVMKADAQPEEAERKRKKPPLTAVVIDVQLVRDMSKPKEPPEKDKDKVFNLDNVVDNNASEDKQEASAGNGGDGATDRKTASLAKQDASDNKKGVSQETACEGKTAPVPGSPVPAATLPDVPPVVPNVERKKPPRRFKRVSVLSPLREEESSGSDKHLLMSEKQVAETDGEYRQAVAKKLGVAAADVSVCEVLENGETRVRGTSDGGAAVGIGTRDRTGSVTEDVAATDTEADGGTLTGDGSERQLSELDLESVHQSEIQYKTVVQDFGQDVDTVTQHLLSQMPKLGEVIEDIAAGPGNPKELQQATFQLIPRTYTMDERQEETWCFSILQDAALPPKPIEPTSEPFGSVPSGKESLKRSPSVSSKKGGGSTKSLKATSGSTTASKKASGRKAMARSPQPSKKSGRSSVASEDSMSARPSTVSLDQVSLVSTETKPPPPLVTRWVVPAHGSVALHVHFNSKVETVSDQVLNFEIVGTGRKYNLFCRGIATYPRLNPRPQVVWPKVIPQAPRKGAEPAGVFVEKGNTYMFGPLLVGKSHDRMREGRFPENMVKMKLVNTSGLPCVVNSSLEVDNTGQTFFVEPRDMVVPPNGKGTLTVMAFPKLIKENSLIEDILRITCCQNPQPLVYNLSCHSSKPLLEAEPKDFFFSRVPVGRPVTKSLKLFNRSLLPVGYRVTGLEIIGEEFKLHNDHGVINPNDSATVKLTVHSYRAFLLKKALRFEAYDVINQEMGMIHSEGIPVGCEVYDVQVDISYPKSSSGHDDGELEFAPSRVYEEQKLTMHCRNKGKFAVAYHFHVDRDALPDPGLADSFCIIPHKGLLQAGDKATAVTVTFAPEREVTLHKVPVIRCEILDPAKAGLEDSLAFVPCKVSAKVVYSRYAVQPATDLNFGTMILQTRRERKFTLMNTGDFEFRFTLMRRDGLVTPMAAAGNLKRRQVVEGNVEKNRRVKDSISKAAQGKKDLNNRPDGITGQGSNSRLSIASFTCCPAMGSVGPGQQVVINVECHADSAGRTEVVGIDVSDRGPEDHPEGFPYKLIMEACTPSVDTGLREIFEEHTIVPSLAHVSSADLQRVYTGQGTLCEDERQFLFHSVFVGTQAKALFKLSNKTKLPCDVHISIKGQNAKASIKLSDIFSVSPSKFSLDGKDMKLITVTFSPQAIQSYSCTFDIAVVDPAVVTSSVASRGPKSQCQFEVSGEGALPRLSLVEPKTVLVSGKRKETTEVAQAPLEFARLLPQRCSVGTAVVMNHSPFPCDVEVRLVEDVADNRLVCFSFAAADARECVDVPDPDASQLVDMEARARVDVPARLSARTATPFHSMSLQHALLASAASDQQDGAHRRALMCVCVGAEQTLRVGIKCAPKAVGACAAELQVMAVGNHFETIRVRLVGEGYRDTVQVSGLTEVTSCFPSIASATSVSSSDRCEREVKRSTKLKSASRMAVEEAGRCWHVDFDGTEVNVKKSLHFTVINHDAESVLKFKFTMPTTDSSVIMSFVPHFGHIGPGCSKIIHATVVAVAPVTVRRLCFTCSTSRIKYRTPPDAESLEARDWDEQSVVSRIVESVPTGKDRSSEQPKQILQLEDEPDHTVLSGTNRNLAFAASMTCAYAEYACPQATLADGKAPVLEFRDTAFYQARDTTVPLTNTGKVALRYSWTSVAEPAADLRTASQLSIPLDLFDALLLPLKRRQHLPAFFIEPNEGTVPVGETVNFKITFRPILPGRSAMKLECSVANLSPKLQQPAVALEGVGVVPIAHIDLPPSDYLTGARRATELKTEPDHTLPAGAKLQVNTKVLEFTSHAAQPVVREFFVANPTAHPWKYIWEMNPITPRDAEAAFRFAAVEGDIEPGQRARVLVEFRASNIRFLESFWNFTIPSQQLSIPFLLVGRMEDPSVTLSTTVINFGSTLTGRKVKRTLEISNGEDSFVEFAFSDPARKVDSHTANVVVNPRQGKVPPNSKKPVDVELLLYMEKEVSFNISCKVKGTLKTLPVNIKADGYAVHVEGSLEAPAADGKTEVKSLELEPSRNVVDFGKVQVNEKVVRTVSVYNAGRFPAMYRWRLSESCDAAGGVAPADVHSGKGQKKLIALKPGTKGAIEPASTQKFTFVFCPGQKKVLAGCDAVCQMAYGPSLQFVFAGEGVKPSLHFSFTKYNFGPCFAARPVESCQCKALTITNNHSQAVSLKSLLSNSDDVSVLFKACVVQPGRSKDAVFQFHPRAVGKVSVDCRFEVNGLSTIGVKISGEGTIMKVEVADPEQKQIKLRTVQAHHTCSQPVKLVNRSSAPITFDVGLSPRATLEPGVLTIKPHSDILLGPGATGTVVVTFSPTLRMPRFSEEIIMDCSGSILPLFTVSAACIAREVSLDFRRLAFGDVVLGSATSRRVTMKNSGDLPTRYSWDAAKFGPDFTIWPVEGVIEAGLEVQFTVAFKPVNLSKDIRYEDLKCRLENAEALPLNLTGACVPRSTAREPIPFQCHVRGKDVKTIQIKNPSTQSWTLRPVIEGHYWSGADTITVEPLSTKQYEVVYRPIAMAVDKKHQGSAFIALPDGNAIYYVFTGATQEAKVIAATNREWPCKREHVEVFTLSNWLKTPQRFMVKIDTLKPDRPDPSTSIKGLEYVDVPASGKASYQLKFRAHREGTTSMKITFRNPETKESMVYTLSVKSSAADSIETIRLCTPVRQGLPHLLVVRNPLDCPVVFSTAISCNEISLPQQFTVPGKSDGECTLQYLPLKVGRSAAKLTFSSHDLGSYVYELEMEASLAPPEQALCFRAPLGEKLVQTCNFTNYARTKTEYLCKVDNPNFLVERSISALAAVPGGTALSTDVTFEPQWLGSSTGTLTVASNTGGEYQFPIRGTCLQPKPQGPIVVKGHSAATIQFKNVFAKAARFHFSVDSAAFSLRSSTDTIRPRKIYYVMVSCEGNHPGGSGVSGGGGSAGGGGGGGGGGGTGGGATSAMQQRGHASSASVPGPAPTGTLTVTCTAESLRDAELPCTEDIRWIYYLRGAP